MIGARYYHSYISIRKVTRSVHTTIIHTHLHAYNTTSAYHYHQYASADIDHNLNGFNYYSQPKLAVGVSPYPPW